MNSGKTCVIGLMSGTSLDGLDLIYLEFDKNNHTNFTIKHSETVSYSSFWMECLEKANLKSKDELILLDNAYGELLSRKVNDFINKNKLTHVDFIASHGHTVLHQPQNGITLQIGNGQVLSDKTSTMVVCDFRTQDVKLGGQGAPLVPIGDEKLFSKYDACLNLGGFANISYNDFGNRIAYDVCPVNIVLNYYTRKEGKNFDYHGEMAKSGTVNYPLLEKLNALVYYEQNYPKTLGLEWVQQNVFPLLDIEERNVFNVLRTFVEHVAIQLAKSLEGKSTVLVTGGGAFNRYLIERLKDYCSSEIIIPNDQLVNFKEALIFAYLGLLRIENKVNCLQSVTGAIKDHCSGEIFIPQ